MGNIEKLVVLAVLFVSAIVLAVALRSDEGEVEAAGPLDEARARTALTVPAIEPEAEAPAGATPDWLLSAEVRDPARGGIEPATPAEGVAPAGNDGILLTSVRGLESSGMDDYRVYQVREGDTWSALSGRFYGDTRHMALLRSANEDLGDLTTGRRILVPVYDFAREAGQREPYEPVDRGTSEPVAPAAGEVYVVKDGDNLSSISKAVYGSEARWEEIYKANKNVLDDPDWLQVGMKLRIPAKATKSAREDKPRPR